MIKNRNTMKITSLLIIISCIALLFTSCEKDEMDKTGNAGGGMDNSVQSTSMSVLRSLESNVDFGLVRVNVTNINGEVVFYRNVDTSLDENTSIDTSDLPSGVYYIDIVGEDGKLIEHDSFIIK